MRTFHLPTVLYSLSVPGLFSIPWEPGWLTPGDVQPIVMATPCRNIAARVTTPPEYPGRWHHDPVYMSRKNRKFRTEKFDTEINGNFDSCNSCKRLGTSRLHELHEPKFPFVSRIEFIRWNFRIFLLMYTGSILTGVMAALSQSARWPPLKLHSPFVLCWCVIASIQFSY